jgi:SHS2 domain-containing protein
VRGIGDSCEAAFAAAARALTAIVTDLDAVRVKVSVPIQCEAPDRELLFVEFLNALIFEMATRRLLFATVTVELSGNRLRGTAHGEPVDLPRHQPAVEPKGATLTELRVMQRVDGSWVAQCVVDV